MMQVRCRTWKCLHLTKTLEVKAGGQSRPSRPSLSVSIRRAAPSSVSIGHFFLTVRTLCPATLPYLQCLHPRSLDETAAAITQSRPSFSAKLVLSQKYENIVICLSTASKRRTLSPEKINRDKFLDRLYQTSHTSRVVTATRVI